MRRRPLLAGLIVLPAGARAQQQPPVIGYLSLRSAEGSSVLLTAFQRGLAERGFEENRTVTIAYAFADARLERLRELAVELVKRQVSVIFASSSNAALAAQAATGTIPIVYTGASDPVKIGLAQSLARPGGNVTGFTMYSHTFSAKRLELLHELVPQAATGGVLVNPLNPSAQQETQDLRQAAATLGLQVVFVEARADGDIEPAFARLGEAQARALYLVDDPLFGNQYGKLAELALKGSLPAISTLRAFADAGALASYGTDFAQLHHDAGVYVARILKGEKPAELPIMLPTKFTLTLNLKTAKALGLAITPAVLGRADEVIE
jgi:putative tryptophan/tyrosine transport system substrate-binding protein